MSKRQRKIVGTNGTKQALFLEALGCLASISAACKIARVPRRTIYNWRSEDEGFATRWDRAIELGIDALEDEAIRRAVVGTRKPVFWKGRRVGYIREVSDSLLMFILKAYRPNKYRENVKVTGRVTGGVLIMGPMPSEEEWEKQYGGDRSPHSVQGEEKS